jgi:hypothetical protein
VTAQSDVAMPDPSADQIGYRAAPFALARLLRRAVGLDEALLARLEGDRRWYTGQILLVAGVATMAAISMTTALAMTTGTGPLGWPLAFGLGLGAFVAACDLTIVLPDGQSHRRSPSAYAGRVAFSILMGGLAAMPLTAAILQRDVDHHESTIRSDAIEAADVAHDRQLDEARAAVARAHRPAVEAATAAREAARRQAEELQAAETSQRAECNAEINGTAGSGLAGEGPRASTKCTVADQLGQRAADAQRRADSAEADLTTAVRTAATDADNKADAVPGRDLQPYQPTELGIADRISRTHDRLGTAGTIAITFALMTLDTLPVILKLSHGTTGYERILARRHEAETARVLARVRANAMTKADRTALRRGPEDEPDEAPLELLLLDDDRLAAFLRIRLAVDPEAVAKDLYVAARAQGYDRSYPTFTRFLRARDLRSVAPRAHTSPP